MQDSGVRNSNPTVRIILIYNTGSTIVTTAVAAAVNSGCGRCYISCSFVWRAVLRPVIVSGYNIAGRFRFGTYSEVRGVEAGVGVGVGLWGGKGGGRGLVSAPCLMNPGTSFRRTDVRGKGMDKE